MRLAGDVLFNLMLNSVASFWLGLLVALLMLRLSKPSRTAACVALLLLPVAKLLWDLRAGIPAASFFWASEQGVKQRLGQFQIGIGAHPWGLAIDGHLWANHATGRSPQSIADLLSRALRYRVSVYAASLVSFAVLTLSLVKFSLHSLGLWTFRRQTQGLLAGCANVEWRSLGRRRVRVCVSRQYTGVPFAGGLFRPYVMLPAALAERLSEREREAVVQHELGHVRYFDLALLLPLELLCAFFWFVPGLKWLVRRLRAVLEQRADDCAVAAGVSAETVASVLLLAAERALGKTPLPLLGMCRESSALRQRVRRLLAPEPARVEKPWLAVARGLLLLWLALGVLQASACGNHP
ncbi:MAG TPA: M56 family metallopeptidase [Polyangiaceae bacterium]|nr:M56 family metallopeptidase [Polyangiaceae bacterium]